jgi:hypothetical protein
MSGCRADFKNLYCSEFRANGIDLIVCRPRLADTGFRVRCKGRDVDLRPGACGGIGWKDGASMGSTATGESTGALPKLIGKLDSGLHSAKE